MMKRTQLYLNPAVYKRVAREAKRRKCTMAKLMRESIEKDFGALPKKGNAHVLVEMAQQAREIAQEDKIKAPKDLSQNIDYYLYGDGRIE